MERGKKELTKDGKRRKGEVGRQDEGEEERGKCIVGRDGGKGRR